MPYITGSPDGWRRSQEYPMTARLVSHDSPSVPASALLMQLRILGLGEGSLAIRTEIAYPSLACRERSKQVGTHCLATLLMARTGWHYSMAGWLESESKFHAVQTL